MAASLHAVEPLLHFSPWQGGDAAACRHALSGILCSGGHTCAPSGSGQQHCDHLRPRAAPAHVVCPLRSKISMLASSSTQHSLPPPRAARSVKHSLADSNVASKISADDAAKVEEEVEAALRWVQTNQVSRPGLLSLLVDGRFGHCFGVVEQCSEQGAGCSATLNKSTSPSCQQLSSTLPVQLMPAEKYEERKKQVEVAVL